VKNLCDFEKKKKKGGKLHSSREKPTCLGCLGEKKRKKGEKGKTQM
jgi:hypothetical protein